MKILSAIAILTLPLHSLGLQGDFDDKYGHVKPSCEGTPITQHVTLDDLVSQQRETNDRVTVPCGVMAHAVHGSTYNLDSGLEVLGELTFDDNPNSDNETIVEAPFILVRGHLEAGTIDKPFQSKLRFVLTEFKKFPNIHYNLTVDHDSTNDLFDHSMNFGDKAFVVFGGTISLCGPREKMIAKLSKTVKSGTSKIRVKGDWTKVWKAGDHLVITSTAPVSVPRLSGISREFTVSSIENSMESGKHTNLLLDEQFITDNDFSNRKVRTKNYKGKKRNMKKRASIFKLTRNIVIQGIPIGFDTTDFVGSNYNNVNPDLRGGHFVVAHTPKKQIIQGVEFSAMGQTGILGRYPIHFHACGNIDSGTILKYNSIHHSQQRCVVIHATNGLTIQKNAAFWAHDHCYMTEDGYEHSNTFKSNIATNVQKAAFWMANPSNELIDNIASNARSGFDISETPFNRRNNFSFKHEIPCQEGGWGNAQGCTWSRFLPMAKFYGNEVHNVDIGIDMYPPRYPSYKNDGYDDVDVLESFLAWNVRTAFDSFGSNTRLVDFTVLDSKVGIALDASQNNVIVEKSVFYKVCEGVKIGGRNDWTRLHSGVKVKDAVFDRMPSEATEHCAPITFWHNAHGYKAPNKWTKVSTQVRDVKLYKVKKLFAFDSDLFKQNTRQHGFFIYNVLSYRSKLKHIAPASDFDNEYQPSYVLRHDYPENQMEGGDFLMEGCEKSIIGGYPMSNEFSFCKGQCWRPVAIMFKRTLGDNTPVSIKLMTEPDKSFFLREGTVPLEARGACNHDEYVQIIQLIPAGKYKISLVESETKKPLVQDLQNEADIKFYYADQGFPGFDDSHLGCLDNVVLEFNGSNIEVSDLNECNPYWG